MMHILYRIYPHVYVRTWYVLEYIQYMHIDTCRQGCWLVRTVVRSAFFFPQHWACMLAQSAHHDMLCDAHPPARPPARPHARTHAGIPKGVTILVGGGFHGKSTLLRALEVGCFDKVPGDGREFVVADPSTVKVRAEDGRSITGVDVHA